MTLLANIFQDPIFLSGILPLIGVVALVALLLWDSRLPVERRILRRLKKAAKERRHHHAPKAMS